MFAAAITEYRLIVIRGAFEKILQPFGARIFGFGRGFGEGAGLKTLQLSQNDARTQKDRFQFSLPNGCSIFENALNKVYNFNL